MKKQHYLLHLGFLRVPAGHPPRLPPRGSRAPGHSPFPAGDAERGGGRKSGPEPGDRHPPSLRSRARQPLTQLAGGSSPAAASGAAARPGNGKRTRAPGCGGASGAPGKRKHRARGELPLGEAARALPVPAALLPPIGARGVTCSSRPAPLVPPRPRGGRAPGLERAGSPPGGLLAKGSWVALLEPLPA